jgi:tRNA-modifying protein YgfZ
MDNHWINQLQEDVFGEITSNFGDAEGELVAARDGAVVSPLIEFGAILASGPDAAPFLHNLLTNDVKEIVGTSARFAGMCTPKGRLLATMLVLRIGDDLLVVVPRDVLAGLLKKLTMYVLRSKVRLTDASSDLALIGTSNLASISELGLGETPYSGATYESGHVFRLDSRRTLFIVPTASAVATWTKLRHHATAVGTEAWQWLEIQAGQPRVTLATQELFVPQMLNMEHPAVAGVSFTKGCYPGQEIVARTQYLGKIKRRMYLVHIVDSVEVRPGSPIFSTETGGQQCGSVVSVAFAPEGGRDALVCIQSTAAESGEINLESPEGPRPIIGKLPYLFGAADA